MLQGGDGVTSPETPPLVGSKLGDTPSFKYIVVVVVGVRTEIEGGQAERRGLAVGLGTWYLRE